MKTLKSAQNTEKDKNFMHYFSTEYYVGIYPTWLIIVFIGGKSFNTACAQC